MKYISHFFSTILHPLLMPLYGALILLYYVSFGILPPKLQLTGILIVALSTLVIPALGIFTLYIFNVVKSMSLYARKDRLYPYIITLMCYSFCALVFYRMNFPTYIVGVIIGGFISLFIDSIITLFWKISAHMTGIGGLLAVSTIIYQTNYIPLYLYLGIIVLAGILGTSRIYLKCHTLGQVLSGTINGFVCIYFSTLYL
ncbi:MAG: hypothetical protein Q4F97_08615 [Bacteroidales bacterium]|nr:hypothetical protein [Bacteroidales bacterium]